jgi:hypothetical protein
MGQRGGDERVNDFHEDLDFSHQSTVEDEFWVEAYQRFFVDYQESMTIDRACAAQYRGVDRVVALSSGKTVRIDEKTRRDDYGDILLEYCSNDTTEGNDGWMNEPLLIDYLAYGIRPTGTVYMLPWEALRRAWIDNRASWLRQAKADARGFTHVSAHNDGYVTKSIAIDVDLLMNTVRGSCEVQI